MEYSTFYRAFNNSPRVSWCIGWLFSKYNFLLFSKDHAAVLRWSFLTIPSTWLCLTTAVHAWLSRSVLGIHPPVVLCKTPLASVSSACKFLRRACQSVLQCQTVQSCDPSSVLFLFFLSHWFVIFFSFFLCFLFCIDGMEWVVYVCLCFMYNCTCLPLCAW